MRASRMLAQEQDLDIYLTTNQGSATGRGSKPMVPFWGRCTTHFSLFWWGLGCSRGVRGFDPWPTEQAVSGERQGFGDPVA